MNVLYVVFRNAGN